MLLAKETQGETMVYVCENSSKSRDPQESEGELVCADFNECTYQRVR